LSIIFFLDNRTIGPSVIHHRQLKKRPLEASTDEEVEEPVTILKRISQEYKKLTETEGFDIRVPAAAAI
jgi:hypothetical protein